jgi:hypothetical protein
MGDGLAQKQTWYTTRQFQVAALLILAVVLAIEGYLAIWRRDNDFLVHREFGRAILAGDPYQTNLHHYPVTRGLINSLTAWLPYRADRALHFGTAVVALGLSLYWWERMTRGKILSGRLAIAAALFTLGLTGAYVLRDLEECGLQLWLLFFLSAAAWSLSLARPVQSGFWLALAAVYKVTPLVFLPYLLWKRQWRAAAAMAVFIVLFSLAPAFFLGWDATLCSHRLWFAVSSQSMPESDPSMVVFDPWQTPIEQPRHVNQGLPVAIARYLQTYPPGHSLAMDHPWFVQFGNLEPRTAKRVINIILLLFAALLAWRFRRPVITQGPRIGLASEWAAVTLLCAILSPMCWLQHLVLIVPCVFLWLRAWLAGPPLPRWQNIGMTLVALIALCVHRELMTRDFYDLMVSYKVHTAAALIALGLVLTLPDSSAAVAVGQEEEGLVSVVNAKAA